MQFDAPIAAPGTYDITVGPVSCHLKLPAQQAACGDFRNRVIIEDFGIKTVQWEGSAPRTIEVTIVRDGAVELSQTVAAESETTSRICGETCTHTAFALAAPENLKATLRAPCDIAQLSGEYALLAASATGECPDFGLGSSLTLENGLPRLEDATCEAAVLSWLPDSCTLSAQASCKDSNSEINWLFDVTDAVGDGSRLIGTGQVNSIQPLACSGSFSLELDRLP